MANQADFYTGRGPFAAYLGSTEHGDPQHLNVWEMFQSRTEREYTEAHFRTIVSAIATGKYNGTWPHDYPTSAGTPWTYCWDKGTTYVYHYGVEVAQIRANYHQWQYARDDQGDQVVVDRSRREPVDRPMPAWPSPRTAATTPTFSSGGAR